MEDFTDNFFFIHVFMSGSILPDTHSCIIYDIVNKKKKLLFMRLKAQFVSYSPNSSDVVGYDNKISHCFFFKHPSCVCIYNSQYLLDVSSHLPRFQINTLMWRAVKWGITKYLISIVNFIFDSIIIALDNCQDLYWKKFCSP